MVGEHGILDRAISALVDQMVVRLLPVDFLQRHLVRAHRARWRLSFGLLRYEHARPPLLAQIGLLFRVAGLMSGTLGVA